MSKNILILSTADWDNKYWTNKQNVSKMLAQKGYKIIYVESPGIRKPSIFSKKDIFRTIKKFFFLFCNKKSDDNNITIISPPLIPFKEKNQVFFRLFNFLLENKILKEVKKKKIKRIYLITYHPYFQFNKLNEFIVKTIYHCVDDLSSIKGIDKKNYKIQEKSLLKKCNYIFTSCNFLYYKFKKIMKNVYFLKNAVTEDFIKASKKKYLTPNEFKKIKRPIFFYHGVLSDFKLDFKKYYDFALKNNNASVVFIGEEYELNDNYFFNELRKLINVFFIKYVEYINLPKYIKHVDCALLLYKKNSYTENMFPLKINEYLICGCKVLMTNISSSIHFKNKVYIYKNNKNFLKYILNKNNNQKKISDKEISYEYLVNTIIKNSIL